MLEFILPNTPVEALSPREIYIDITNKYLRVFEEVNLNLLETFNLSNINWVCYKEFPCLPSELMNHYRYSKNENLDLNLIEATYSKVTSSIADEKQCLAFEFFKKLFENAKFI